jgi:hypothetical protein
MIDLRPRNVAIDALLEKVEEEFEGSSAALAPHRATAILPAPYISPYTLLSSAWAASEAEHQLSQRGAVPGVATEACVETPTFLSPP